MRPRWHFVLRGGLWFVGTILAALTLLYLASFIVFTMHQSGSWFVPGFGWSALGVFFRSLPFLLVFLALLFMVLLEVLVSRYTFAYDKPLLYSALAIIVLVIFGGLAVGKTSLHSGLFRQAGKDRLPFAGELYRGYGMARSRELPLGMVEEITEDGWNVRNFRGEIVHVLVTPATSFPFGEDIEVGDTVVIFGEPQGDGVIKAFGAREISEDDVEAPPRRMMK